MPEPAVRRLAVDDLDGALRLSSTAGWNQRLEDWRMLLNIAPRGAFCAVDGDRLVGTAIGIDYGTFGWIAMMLVDPAHRGKGLGARLLEAAMSTLPAGQPIRLDATPMGRPLYERHGFVEETRLTRYVAPARDVPPADAATTARVRAMTERDLDGIIGQGPAPAAGARATVLRWVLEQSPQYARLMDGKAGPQYCLGRPGRLFDQIGPVVAENADAARALVTSVLPAAQGRPLVVDAYDEPQPFAAALTTLGFVAQRPLFRMCRASATVGPPPAGRADGPREYAILGPEFA